MSDVILTPNESQIIAELRMLKENGGHGKLEVEVRDGIEVTPIRATRYVSCEEKPAARKRAY